MNKYLSRLSMKLHDLVVRERPRERLLQHGVHVLSDAELLALILCSGTKNENAVELGARLLKKYDLHKISTATLKELCSLKGIGIAKACQLLAAFELQRRVPQEKERKKISDGDDAYAYCKPLLAHLEQEHFLVVFLDTKNNVLGHEFITKGLVNSSLVHPREVFRYAIRNNANAVIVAHNHPSGDCTPSDEDTTVTRVLTEAGELIGISVLDHIIVSRQGYERVK